jgi:pyruvate dehydrogenase E2 component (dihydrolipoamide acetyltransferase)
MPTEFTLPELGENITAGDVVRVLVKAGDTIAKDQPVLELETDKATIEVPASVGGTIKELKIKQGDKIKVGQVVLTLDEGAAGAAVAETPAGADGAKPKAQPEGAPVEGGLSQGEPGAAAKPAEDSAESASGAGETADAEGEDEAAGGEKPKRGEVVDIRGARAAAQPQPPAGQEGGAADAPAGPSAAAAPSVRRLARELGVDINHVAGSGDAGRISLEDVQAHVRTALQRGGTGTAAPQLPDFTKWGAVERKPMSNIRRKTAEHLSMAWQTIPHVTQHDKADITALEALRKQYGAQAEKAGGKMTMTSIAMKIVAGAMQRFPQFNAAVDVARQEIVYKKAIHIGVAADTPRGLLVPVIRDVDRKGVIDLSVELTKASERARAGKLSLDEMQGGGMTITNLGGIGGTSFTPIVNWPEVAILGISRGAMEPRWIDETEDEEPGFEARLMLPLSLSYDHRVIDGADAARFLRWVAEAFEQPFVLAL